ncbi:MAG: chromosomal replication initiator protein DnaA [Clostridia bacterium]|nr:chromosomal replication initiator protein DnaA [Clostridia bacterium]
MNSFNELWDMVKEECQSLVSESIYNVWFKDMELISFDEEKVVLAVTGFKKKVIENRFMDKLRQSFYNIMGFDIAIELIESVDYTADEKRVADEKVAVVSGSDAQKDTFESFVVGSSNKFAHAAAIAVAANPGGAYNPLLIHGNSGLGKTHLLNAICNEVKKNNPNANIVYTSGEAFTNELVHYLALARNNKTPNNMVEFHNKYRSADILLVDDVQFIAGKEATQEEFFHTFNALSNAGNQIVLTSDMPPKEIATLDDRLRNRFEWGLIADIQPPDIETRMAIIKRKAENLNLMLGNDVVEYIAQKLKDNIRQLEGAVNKMNAYVTMQGMPTSITTAQAAIKDILVDNQPQPITVERIVQEVARTYGVSAQDILSKRQDSATVEMRQMSIYIVRELTGMSTNSIGKEFGGKNHTTILYSLEQFEGKLKNRSDLREKVKNITKNVQERR